MLTMCKSKLLLAAVISISVTNVLAAPPIEWVEGQIIVKPRAGLSDAQFAKILNKAKGRSVSKLQQINAHIVQVPPQAEDAVIRALSHNPNIDYAEKDRLVAPNAITPDDPKYASQWHLPKIQAPDAWGSTAGEGITVAILDTGVEASHPDLVSNLVPGWNVVSNNSDTSPVMWHGTGVAGTVAATGNNATGVASVAWNARIMPIRITDRTDGVASWSAMANGFLWAADHGADVANLSYGLSTDSSTINNAAQYLRNKGGLAVAAAGNNNTDRGFADNPYLITVSATTSGDGRASYSNYGDNIDVAAPGSSIYTTYTNGGYKSASGTSFASPATAGVVALIMAANPGLSPDEVEGILESSAMDLGDAGWDPLFGHGRVNAGDAVLIATQTSNSDTQAPAVTIVSPGYNATVSGNVLVDVDASDNTGVSEVVLYANGQVVGTDRTAPYQFSWDSTQVADGNATFTAYAYDAARNTGLSSGVTVSIDNVSDVVDNTAPVVTLTNPADGSTVSGTVSIYARASDDVGVTQLSVYIDNNLKCSSVDTSTLTCNWNTRKLSGSHSIRAVARDAAGHSSETTISVSVGSSSKGNKGRGKTK